MCGFLFLRYRLMEKWANKEERPASGSLVQLLTEAGITKLVLA